MIETELRQRKFEPDLWINVDAGYNVMRTRLDCQVVNVFTDDHVLDYAFQRTQADINFNMHQHFAKPGDRILPYCASEIFHYPEDVEKEYDVCLIGLHYPERNKLINSLKGMGMSVYYDLGPAYHDYRELYNKSRVAISWSSKGDLIARVFEMMAMKLPLVTDRVPDLPNHFVEDEHYKGFSSLSEAVQKVHWCLHNYAEAMEMAENGCRKVHAQHLYKYRVSDILRECKLI
jgi:spore maturation protein CgeB